MGLTEMREYREKFQEKHGKSLYIVLSEVINVADQSAVEELSKKFCELYLTMHSTYRYNNSEYPGCGEGFYTDTINLFSFGYRQK